MKRFFVILAVLALGLAGNSAANAQPANDDCATATVVGVGANAFDATGATDSGIAAPAGPCGAGFGAVADDVWFSYTPSQTGLMTIETCDAASYDTDLVVYTGGCGALVEYICDGDGGTAGGCQAFDSAVFDVPVTGGTEYLVRIGSFAAGGAGLGTLTISLCPGVNVSGLVLTPDNVGGTVLAEWDNNTDADDVEVFIDGVSDGTAGAQVAGTVGTYNSAAVLAPGTYQVCIVATLSGIACGQVCGTVTFDCPIQNIAGFGVTLDTNTGLVECAWTNLEGYDEVQILIDGVLDGTVVAPGAGSDSVYTTVTPLTPGAHDICAQAVFGTVTCLAEVCLGVVQPEGCPAGSLGPLSPVDPSVFNPTGAVSCNAAGAHVESWYFRQFDICNAPYSVTDQIEITCLGLGVGASNAADGISQPVRLQAYIDPNGGDVGPFEPDPMMATPTDMQLVYSEEFEVPGGLGDVVWNLVPGSGILLAGSPIIPCLTGNEQLIIGINTPGGNGDGFFMGIPQQPVTQVGASWIYANGCGLTTPLTMATIGFPDNMWIMELSYADQGDCVCSEGVVGLTCAQTPATSDLVLNWDVAGAVTSIEVEELTSGFAVTLPGTALTTTIPGLPAGATQVFVTALNGATVLNTRSCSPEIQPVNSWPAGALTAPVGSYIWPVTNATETTGLDLDVLVCDAGTGLTELWRDGYYCYTHTSVSGPVVVSTCNPGTNVTTQDTNLAVYDNGCADNTDPALVIACDDDQGFGNNNNLNAACDPLQAELVFDATQGNSYLIRVGVFNPAAIGDIELTINDCVAPINLTATSDCTNGDVTLGWDANPSWTSIDIERDGVNIATLLGSDVSYIDLGVANGSYTYTVIADCGSGPNPNSVDTSVAVITTETDLILASERLEGTGDIDSAAALKAALDSIGVSSVVADAGIMDYPCLNASSLTTVWVMTGSFPQDYRIDGPESDVLGQANIDGLAVYFEGGDNWGFLPVAGLFAGRDGVNDATADDGDDSLTSMDGGVGSGLDLSDQQNIAYSQDQAGNDFTDRIQPATADSAGTDASIVLTSDDALPVVPYGIMIAYNTDSGGKTVSSSVEFGGWTGDPTLLAQRLSDYLAGGTGTQFKRGDCNGDSGINIADAIFLLAELFSGGPSGPCADACDINDDGGKNIADAIFVLANLFSGGPPPPAPNPACGDDPTADMLDCAAPTGGC